MVIKINLQFVNQFFENAFLKFITFIVLISFHFLFKEKWEKYKKSILRISMKKLTSTRLTGTLSDMTLSGLATLSFRDCALLPLNANTVVMAITVSSLNSAPAGTTARRPHWPGCLNWNHEYSWKASSGSIYLEKQLIVLETHLMDFSYFSPWSAMVFNEVNKNYSIQTGTLLWRHAIPKALLLDTL